MEITAFITSKRETLLIADHNNYRSQLSRQILAIRKRLGRATPKREKFTQKPITAAEIASNHEFVHLFILVAERAWAHAMHIKSSHAEDVTGKGITGSARGHLISKLWKAAKTADELLELLKERESKAGQQDVLEAIAYQATMSGAEEFEKQAEGHRGGDAEQGEKRWENCLSRWSQARVLYAALYEKEKKEVFREVLANSVDPTIRYAAYQARLSRTIAISTVAKRFFPRDDNEMVKVVESLDQWALKDRPVPQSGDEKKNTIQEVPNSVTWRGRKANIIDASIGQALAAVKAAEARLKVYLAQNPSASTRDKATAYDDILIAAQDATDATKKATDELEKERVDEGDARMQDLRVTSLAVNYDLVSWRVGRNRILIGEDDGCTFEAMKQKKSKQPRKDGTEYPDKEEGRGRKLARLRERIVLYDATIQSVNSVKDFRGAMRDEAFVSELDGKANYFRALRCLNISFSHTLLGNHLNALVLLQRAQNLLSASSPPTSSNTAEDTPPSLEIPFSASTALREQISTLLSRTHALVELYRLSSNSSLAAQKHLASTTPTVQTLNAYPSPGTQIDIKNLVAYPPKIEPVPVKPLFLDVAWNYIDYPGRQMHSVPVVGGDASDKMDVDEKSETKEPVQEKKRGWFGFGR